MGSLRFIDIQSRPTEVLDLTSRTVEECRPVAPPFEAAFQAPMAHWRLDGRPRTAHRYTTYQHCPLPTPEERLLCILVYLKTSPLQVVQGRLFGMGQRTAHQWIHSLLVVLRATLHARGEAPGQAVAELATHRGVAEVDATAMVVPSEPPPAPAAVLGPAPPSPLLGTTPRSGASGVPRVRLSRRAVIAASKKAPRGKTCC